MAVFTVTNSGAAGETGLTFEAALQAAADRPGADTIQFAEGIQIVRMLNLVSINTEITINGDRDNDGISDVVILAAEDKHHLTIDHGGKVTIRNVDFAGGYSAPETYEGAERLPAQKGSAGGNGTTQQVSANFMDGAEGLNDAGDGGKGADGLDGLDAVGSILNRGTLTLERVGFGLNYASGEHAQSGGNGGDGGNSLGGDGMTDGWGAEVGEGPVDTSFDFYLNLLPGGRGGNGGDAGDAGDGGNGGNGGTAAAAIMNEGTLTLTDVVFGGRLTSGVLLGGNGAFGGAAGHGGAGGVAGSSRGGNGGDSGRQYLPEFDEFLNYEIPEDADWDYEGTVSIAIHTQGTAPAGQGGNGGTGGNGGDGGNGGNGGNAATIVNRGTLTGKAAIISIGDEDDPLTNWSVLSGDGGSAGIGTNGGRSYGGEGGIELGSFQSVLVPFDLRPSHYTPNGEPVPPFVTGIWDDLHARFGENVPLVNGPHAFTFEGYAPDGMAGAGGTAGNNGIRGMAGEAVAGVLNEGSSSLQTADTLIYVHALGQDPVTGKLAFNVIRIGDPRQTVELSWSLQGIGENAVSIADFTTGTQLSGTLKFNPVALTMDNYGQFDPNDRKLNVIRVELEVAADRLDEAPEGYRFELTNIGSTAALGTSVAIGTIIDTMLDAANEPIRGTAGADRLKGTGDDDIIYGLGGNDILKGFAGADTMIGGKGVDKLYGGAGPDTFVFATGDSGKKKSKADTIYDFTKADTIDLSGWDANAKKTGDQDFVFIDSQNFHGKAGELRFVKEASDTWIMGDTNGDRKADFIIHLDDAIRMKAGYFDL